MCFESYGSLAGSLLPELQASPATRLAPVRRPVGDEALVVGVGALTPPAVGIVSRLLDQDRLVLVFVEIHFALII
jgi:hypothetical protein